MSDIENSQKFNFLILGGGASACGIASSLCKKGSVAIFERGLDNLQHPESRVISGWPFILDTCAAERIDTEELVQTFAPNVLGGGTSLNVGVWVRETEEYFKSLNIDFDYSKVEEAYQRIEEKLVSKNGTCSFSEDYKYALAEELGVENHGHELMRKHEGAQFTYSIFSKPDGNGERIRHSAAELLDRENQNLHLYTQHLVHRILFNTQLNPPKAIGVEVEDLVTSKTKTFFIEENGTVFVCGGAIYSPQILMQSGIGPKAELEAHGIKPIAYNEAVGKNFVDKPINSLAMRAKEKPVHGLVETIATGKDYAFASTSGGEIVALMANISNLTIPPVLRHNFFVQLFFRILFLIPFFRHYVDQSLHLIVFTSEPKSRGSIRLRSKNPRTPPIVKAGYFSNPEDFQGQKSRVKSMIRIAFSKRIQKYLESSVLLYYILNLKTIISAWFSGKKVDSTRNAYHLVGPFVTEETIQSEEKLEKWVKNYYSSSFHTAGSNSGAIDRQFNVLGVTNLKVVDASALEKPPRTHMQATLIMMGKYVGEATPSPLNPTFPARPSSVTTQEKSAIYTSLSIAILALIIALCLLSIALFFYHPN